MNRSVRVYTGPSESTTLGPDDALDGRDILPGFKTPISALFPPRAAS